MNLRRRASPGPASPRPARTGSCRGNAGVWLASALLCLALPARADDDAAPRQTLLGDLGGARPALEDRGVTFGLADIEEVFADTSGGMRRGGAYDGATALSLALDLDTLAGWSGATVALAAAELRGHGLSQHDVGNLLTVSDIEARPETRLFDLYWEQSLADGALSLRAGQMSPADEFLASHYAANFLNASFAWPAIAGADLPGDDPVGLISTPGLRVRLAGDRFSIQAGVFKGTASDGGPLEARAAESDGDGVLILAEAGYKIPPDDQGTLPASLKFGAWYHTAEFDDLHLDRYGQSLAFVTSAPPRRHQGDWGIYAGADRMLWHITDTPDGGIGGFLRLAGAPGDRNLIQVYADAGLTYKGALPGRPDDVLGLAVAYARIGQAATALDRDYREAYPEFPIRDAETVIELGYQLVIAPWWTLQPDCQYVIHPGGPAPDPGDPGLAPIADALVVGLRSTVKF